VFEVFAKKKSVKKKLEDKIKLVADLKDYLKTDSTFKDLCEEYDQDGDIIDGISVFFTSDIDVTAKTINSKVFLNSSLLGDKFEIIARYLLHELTHCFQHMEKEGKVKKKKEKVYLDRPEELEAFQFQLEFDADKRSVKQVNKYVDDLLSYHKIPKKKRKEKKEELLHKVES
jgi:hypothetical protein